MRFALHSTFRGRLSTDTSELVFRLLEPANRSEWVRGLLRSFADEGRTRAQPSGARFAGCWWDFDSSFSQRDLSRDRPPCSPLSFVFARPLPCARTLFIAHPQVQKSWMLLALSSTVVSKPSKVEGRHWRSGSENVEGVNCQRRTSSARPRF